MTGFAPDDPAFVADSYPVYDGLCRAHPALYDEGTDHWLVSRFEDVNALLRDRRLGRTYLHVATHEEMGRQPPPAWHAPFWDLINAGILEFFAHPAQLEALRSDHGLVPRDPAVFDAPDELRLDRSPNPHLTFGAGIHFYLGAPPGRIELQEPMRGLLERFPAMEPAEQSRFKANHVIRGLDGLRVRL